MKISVKQIRQISHKAFQNLNTTGMAFADFGIFRIEVESYNKYVKVYRNNTLIANITFHYCETANVITKIVNTIISRY